MVSIPSLCVGLRFKDDSSLFYSGPTFSAIRPGKRDSPSAAANAIDFK